MIVPVLGVVVAGAVVVGTPTGEVVLVVLVVEVVEVVVDVAIRHVAGRVIVSSMSVTAAFRARTRPVTVTLDVTVIEVNAMTVPTNVLVEPRVAELPTFQNTLHAWAPPISLTTLSEAVTSVEPAWKTNTALGSPLAFKVSVPVSCSVDVAL
jgi:hypothetical protein